MTNTHQTVPHPLGLVYRTQRWSDMNNGEKRSPDREYAQWVPYPVFTFTGSILPVGGSVLATAGITEGSIKTYESTQNHGSLPES